ncbi:hypothetical protein AMECASPLE_039012 [Ameca splendens]|uniref:Uncharacterized protein n=1 Tax=Ameca splendens TaxID=208324 RepID=A0ABV0Z674_9TELE
MSSLTPFINLLFGLPLGSSSISITLPIYSPSLYTSKPSQSGVSGFIFNTSNMSCPTDVLIPGPIPSCHSQRELQHLHFCYLLLPALSPICKPYSITGLTIVVYTFLFSTHSNLLDMFIHLFFTLNVALDC